jgi:GR25 family glycosyltransferase involved in LPS biosynthesis
MNIINTVFDKIYCINLDSRTDRWERSYNLFKQLGINVTRYSANPGTGYSHNKFINKGEHGCLLSHMEVMQEAESNNLGNILILEDDIEFVRGFTGKFEELWDNTPTDWDLLYLGANNQGTLNEKAPNIYRADKLLTTSSYAVNSTTRKLLISEIRRMDVPVDNIFTRVQARVNCYLYKPYITYQREGFSDIRGGFRNYDRVLRKYSTDHE